VRLGMRKVFGFLLEKSARVRGRRGRSRKRGFKLVRRENAPFIVIKIVLSNLRRGPIESQEPEKEGRAEFHPEKKN